MHNSLHLDTVLFQATKEITNLVNGRCLDSGKPGARRLQLNPCSGSDSQKWKWEHFVYSS